MQLIALFRFRFSGTVAAVPAYLGALRRRHRLPGLLAAALVAVALVVLAPRAAWAAPDDAATSAFVDRVLQEEYASAQFGEAKKKLLVQLDRCRRPGRCSGGARAQIYVALGMIASQLGFADEARNDFTNALSEDSRAHLPASGQSPSMKLQFDDAKKSAAAAAPQPVPTPTPMPTPVPGGSGAPVAGAGAGAGAAGGGDAAGDNGGGDSGGATAPGPTALAGGTPGRAPPGWNNFEAFTLAGAALAADLAGKLDECMEKDKRSLELEEQPRTRLHLASCEKRSGKLIDALKDARAALQVGIQRRDKAVLNASSTYVREIAPRIPKVTFQPPSGVKDVKVFFDDREVKGELTGKYSVDPGHHTVRAEGSANGNPLAYEEEITIKEGETYIVRITLKSKAPEYLTPGQLSCMLSAKSQEDVIKCLPQNAQNLVVKAGFDVGAYTDTNHVHIFSPGVNGSVTSPTAGWNLGGSFLVDFVTAASPDIVSEASRHFVERRYAATLTGGYKPGLYGVQLNGSTSSEPDYLDVTGGLAVTGDFWDKRLTPRLAWSHSDDTIGRNDTPFETFHRKFFVNDFDADVTVVMSPTSVIVLGATFTTERGDQSKIYRFVPMFTPQVAGRVPVGATIDLVNFYRLPLRPIEQLPTERDRYAAGVRFIHRFTQATLRLEERLYDDSWAIKATTTDMRYMQDLGRHLRVWPHLRFHAQTGANFYQLAYSALIKSDGSIVVPTYRTGDRELSPMATVTLGGGTRVALSNPEASTQYGLTLSADLMYSRFFDSLFVTTRTAFYGVLGFDAEFQ